MIKASSKNKKNIAFIIVHQFTVDWVETHNPYYYAYMIKHPNVTHENNNIIMVYLQGSTLVNHKKITNIFHK